MALFAIGDLHLSLYSKDRDRSSKMGRVWTNRVAKIEQNWKELVTDDDTIVIVGDFSWGRNLKECEPDFEYIRKLPGRKVFIRGNHDQFWDVKKTEILNEKFEGDFFFLQNNFTNYNEYALIGTKGFCYEGKGTKEEAEKRIDIETDRLIMSYHQAISAGYSKIILFLHYPPTNILERTSEFTKLAEKFGVEQVIYAHCHGEHRFHDSILGVRHGIQYDLVSGDYLRWRPRQILK